jgi:hypothetical protein
MSTGQALGKFFKLPEVTAVGAKTGEKWGFSTARGDVGRRARIERILTQIEAAQQNSLCILSIHGS